MPIMLAWLFDGDGTLVFLRLAGIGIALAATVIFVAGLLTL